MTKGIFLNGQPLDLSGSIDIEVIQESFQFHYIYHPPAAKGRPVAAYNRHSKVRHIPVEQYLAEKKGGTIR